MAASVLRISLLNNVDELCRLTSAIDQFGKEQGLSKEDVFRLNLVLEEIVTNVISYAFDDDLAHEIEVTVESGEELVVTVEDDGIAFDPLARQPSFQSDSIENTKVGGWGLYLVRSNSKKVSYSRQGKKNRLQATLAIEGDT